MMKITVLLMLAVAGLTATPGLAQIQMEKDAGLDVSALDTALGDLEDSDSTSAQRLSLCGVVALEYGQHQGNRFNWMDGSPWRFTNWMPGEPDNYGSYENCIEIFYSGEPWKMF
ncbi:UNVERIFIED_CONTAM: hypothetical protein FKN15_060789 [Acipenser sinensis]